MIGYFRDKIFSTIFVLLIIGMLVSCSQPKPLSSAVPPDPTLSVPVPSTSAPTDTSTNTPDATSTTFVSHVDRTIDFAGHTWNVKSGCGIGPGPNCWSDSAESVWVQNGELHLKIRQIEDRWHSAEVSTVDCTQYGMHRFIVSDDTSSLDKNVVAAMFLYKDDLNEIDVELSKWAEENLADNAQYVVQPWDVSGNIYRFAVPQDIVESTHSIDWEPSSIRFVSLRGHTLDPPTVDNLLGDWEYIGNNIPVQDDCLRVHINLWQVKGNPPSDGRYVELVITHAQLPAPYLPPPTPFPPTPIPPKKSGDLPWIEVIEPEANYVSGLIGPNSYCNDNYRVVIYAKKDIWYVQPYVDNPLTAIDPISCNWESLIHPWDKLAAFLVPRNYDAPEIVVSQYCPPEFSGSEILASTCFNR